MDEHLHKGWPLTILGAIGSAGTFVANQWLGLVVGIASIVSIVFAVRASRATKRAAEMQEYLAKLQTNSLICAECIQGVAEPEVCPHPAPPYPFHCKKRITP